MKRKEDAPRRISVRSLQELDALVGKFLTGECPRIHWVNTRTDFRFDSVEEAIEAMNDPFFCDLAPMTDAATTVLMEVREFRQYSSELNAAWEIVEHCSHQLEPLLVRREGEKWEGAFGAREFVAAATAPAAICLAALRARGIEVDCQWQGPAAQTAVGVPHAEIKSLYARD